MNKIPVFSRALRSEIEWHVLDILANTTRPGESIAVTTFLERLQVIYGDVFGYQWARYYSTVYSILRKHIVLGNVKSDRYSKIAWFSLRERS